MKKWAVVFGRFQPFHKEHANLINLVSDEYENIIVLLGQQVPNGNNPLHYMHRANFFKNYLEGWFHNFAIQPMYDFKTNEEWASDMHLRIKNCMWPGDDFTLFLPIKEVDRKDSTPWNNALRKEFGPTRIKYVKVRDEEVSATKIRNEYEKYDWMLTEPEMKFYMDENINGYPPKSVAIFPHPWVKVCSTLWDGRSEYIYSSRRNKDSIAFVVQHEDKYGFIIEQKPPLGMRRCVSAFGGSFNRENDDPYLILWNELMEEAGYVENDVEEIQYKGCYMATTQSDEVVHLFLVKVNHDEFRPTTDDPGEMKNTPVWIREDLVHVVDDWKAQMIVR